MTPPFKCWTEFDHKSDQNKPTGHGLELVKYPDLEFYCVPPVSLHNWSFNNSEDELSEKRQSSGLYWDGLQQDPLTLIRSKCSLADNGWAIKGKLFGLCDQRKLFNSPPFTHLSHLKSFFQVFKFLCLWVNTASTIVHGWNNFCSLSDWSLFFSISFSFLFVFWFELFCE